MGGLTSWYRSSAAGIEQGFILSSRPIGTPGSFAIMLHSGGSLTPVLMGVSTLSLRSASGHSVLTYGDLRVTDATGSQVPAHLSVSGRNVQIVVNDELATYPLTIDPLVQQAELRTSDGAAGDYFGASVAISSDGTTAVVGAPRHQAPNDPVQGAAYVFSGPDWTTQTELTSDGGGIGEGFGDSVAISSDGSTIIVGVPNYNIDPDVFNTAQGAAFIFSGPDWGTQTELTVGSIENALFGVSVSLSSSGSIALIGASQHEVGSTPTQGEAFVFSGTDWGTRADLSASDGASDDAFGSSVALSADGSTALIGAPIHKVGNNAGQGAAYVFNGTDLMAQAAELTSSDGAASDQFGTSVALSADGSTALVGAPGHDVGDIGPGAAYIESGADWVNQVELTADDGNAGDEFGDSVALSADASTALAGAPLHSEDSNANQGGAYVFAPLGAPSAPESPGAIAPSSTTLTDGAVVSWSSPISDGGSPIIGYTVTPEDLTTGLAGTPSALPGTATTATITGLLAGDLYDFTVSASNAIGPGPSAATNQVVPVAIVPSASNTGSSSSAGGTATASVGTPGQPGSLIVTASGIGEVTGARYPSDPMPGSSANGSFYDVSIHPGNAFTQATFTVCGVPAGQSVSWWNPSATPPAYQTVSSQSAPAGSCVTVTVNGTTTPNLSQLEGTVFVVPTVPQGYWEVGADGGIFAFGSASFYGSMGGQPLNAPIVGIAVTPDGKGYWEVGADGGIYAFGSADFLGSLGSVHLNTSVVGISAEVDAYGYWLASADGGVFSFGSAGFHGSMGGKPINAPVVGIAS
jgi:hypothetical protein